MAHREQLKFIEAVAGQLPQFFTNAKVLEIGSLNINGTIRVFFRGCEYIGIDVAKGEGVDVVCQGQDYNAPNGAFDHVICCETAEHNPYWQETFRNMIRLCRPGGLITLTCATTGRREHGTSRMKVCSSPLTVAMGWEYYRNLTRRDFARSANLRKEFAFYRFWENWISYDLYFVGIKHAPRFPSELIVQWRKAVCAVDLVVAGSNGSLAAILRKTVAWLFGDIGFNLVRKYRW